MLPLEVNEFIHFNLFSQILGNISLKAKIIGEKLLQFNLHFCDSISFIKFFIYYSFTCISIMCSVFTVLMICIY